MNSEKKPISNTTGNTTTDKIKMKDSGIKDINEIQNQSEINRKTKSNFENDSMPSSSKGRLKIFFGYAAGTGKTYAMLEAGQMAKDRGIDTVIGYLEPHERKQTLDKARGLEVIAPKILEQGNLELSELDTDAVIARKPQLALVDELAHTNAAECRHVKRYQSVKELLMNGIDVYTTLNVQHLESLNDLVASITGIQVAERIPDDVFDLAEQVEFVDIEPEDLLERLREGKIYRPDQIRLASQNFFTIDNMKALRQIALRRAADRARNNDPAIGAFEHVLVCLSSSPSNARIIRSAARMAKAFQAKFTALHIQTPDYQEMDDADKRRLEENMRLANRLGASIESVYGEDIAREIGEFARLGRVSKIVLGRQGKQSAFSFHLPLTDRLAESAPQAEIFIIPDRQIVRQENHQRRKLDRMIRSIKGMSLQAFILLAAFFIALFMHIRGFSETSILSVFIFAIMAAVLLCKNMVQAVLSSGIGLLMFGFAFAHPAFTMGLYDKEYLLIFFIVLASSIMAARISISQKNQAHASARAAALNTLLYEASANLQEIDRDEDIYLMIAKNISAFLGRKTVIYPNEDGKLGKPVYSSSPDAFLKGKEQAVASWVLTNNKQAGAFTDTLSASSGLYLAIRHKEKVYGVIGILLDQDPLSADQNTFLLSMLGQCALALENHAIAREKEKKTVEAEQEKLKAALLRSISHDLRTPLTTISASADMLLHSECSKETQRKLEKAILDDSVWLKDTVENLLSLTRMEDKNLHLNKEVIDLQEAVEEALKHAAKQKGEHPISVEVDDYCYANLDGKLIVQMLINLINNAIFHTTPGVPISVICHQDQNDQMIQIQVKDEGPGISEEQKEHLFEAFRLAHNKISDSQRRMGLGLSLVKSIVEAHQGNIEYSDNHPGACFTICLPSGMGEMNETSCIDCG
ncbi:sensor histidine kinase [Ileibacterium valens]|uniref:sensor histidine kinase n=1 Tax=Ileibacterium valens TaxID=1862668 RepID=UPI00272A9557|nr:sensor histidine kinase KdpD [Ileibacterium valens]